MDFRNIATVTSLAISGILASGTLAPLHAASFTWSYIDSKGNEFTGLFDGTLQPDQNIVDVKSADDSTVNGTLGAATPFVYSVSSGLANPLNPSSPGIVSFNGLVMDFAACTDPGCASRDGFAFGNYYPYAPPGLLFATGLSYRNITEPFNSANWHLSVVPEPSSNLGLGAIALLGIGVRLKRRLLRK